MGNKRRKCAIAPNEKSSPKIEDIKIGYPYITEFEVQMLPASFYKNR